jgi:putative phage-type endonuclease
MTELVDVTDSITPECYFNEDESFEIYDTCIYLINELIENNPDVDEEDLDEFIDDNLEELLCVHFENDCSFAEDELYEIIKHAKHDYFAYHCSSSALILDNTSIIDNHLTDKINHLTDKINHLRSIPQPVQRTKEWYEFRQNLITASNAYKAFESVSMQNQLIYEKCKPLIIEEPKEITIVNTNTTLHWGQKYEPLSVMIYEDRFQTKIEDFGCIQHPKYSFLGASPDGINIDLKSPLYGRMLEIKNVVSRTITGIPKKEYWVQMQLQMEVCDLDECDFLETKFIEIDYDTFISDAKEQNICLTNDDKLKGIIVHLHNQDNGKPFYVYKPLNIINWEEIKQWRDNVIDQYQQYMFVNFIYWKLEQFSCILVTRNKNWFQEHIEQLASIWKIIEKERISGYEHRAPNKRPKKEPYIPIHESQGCLLKPKINVVKL